MHVLKLSVTVAVALLCVTSIVAAQSPGGVVTGGSSDTLVNGKPAARVGDTTTNGAIVEGSPNVFINGKPAAIVGGRSGCGGVVIGGSSNVFVNGKPVATAGTQTGDCKGH